VAGWTLSDAGLQQAALAFSLSSLRFLGLFLALPLVSVRAVPLRVRVAVVLVLAWTMLPQTLPRAAELGADAGFSPWPAAGVELGIGVTVGLAVRVALNAVDLAAELLSVQTGLSFAATISRDVALPSGVIGEILGLTAIALALAMNVHVMLVELVASSFAVVPFGSWPEPWSAGAFVELLARSWRTGLVLATPVLAAHLLLSLVQGVLGRTTPQLNLFSVGFAVSVPLGVALLALLAPELPRFVERALEPALRFAAEALAPPRR
jgi:flagellar biosynthetic protein FliR